MSSFMHVGHCKSLASWSQSAPRHLRLVGGSLDMASGRISYRAVGEVFARDWGRMGKSLDRTKVTTPVQWYIRTRYS